MNTDGIYGYDMNNVISLSMSIIENGVEVLIALEDNGQRNFIDKMAENWACKEAQTFFADYKNKVEKLSKETNDRIHKMHDIVMDGYKKWASEINNITFGAGSGWTNQLTPVDISNIKENFNGVRGINKKAVPEILRYFPQTIETTKQQMNKIRESVNELTFLGGDQQEKLREMIQITTNEIIKSVEELSNETEAALKITLDKYGDIASEVAGKFAAN